MDNSFYLNHVGRPVTQEEIDKFSPDNIDCAEFWEKITENDFEAFCPIAKSADEVNYYNASLLVSAGFYNAFPYRIDQPVEILDIGAGLLAAKSLVNTIFIKNNYYPVDIVRHTPETILIEDGVIPFPDKSIDITISSNVFQHLTIKQITKYVDEIRRISIEGSVCFVGFTSESPWLESKKLKTEDGRDCIQLEEQVMPLYKWQEIAALFVDRGLVMTSYTVRSDGYVGLWFKKVKEDNAN